ncbi:hypothetical protein [Limosilactobacillus caccae]|uniref:hypothetical protein n=1 Tax=Limosilactobacillus caccae TaxID=1926284 RepID=UPI0009707DAF|nr:hypothetical protein [Limosilactobacillus caccae]
MDYFNLPDEDQYIEYKKNSSSLSKEMWETVSSFVNLYNFFKCSCLTVDRILNLNSCGCVEALTYD